MIRCVVLTHTPDVCLDTYVNFILFLLFLIILFELLERVDTLFGIKL